MDKRYQAAFKKHHHSLEYVPENLIDKIWDKRPSPPSASVIVHSLNYSGQSTAGISSFALHKISTYLPLFFHFLFSADKVAKIRTQLDKNADALVVSALDEVACMYSDTYMHLYQI